MMEKQKRANNTHNNDEMNQHVIRAVTIAKEKVLDEQYQ